MRAAACYRSRAGSLFRCFRLIRGAMHEALILLLNNLLFNFRGSFQWENATLCMGVTGITFPFDAIADLPDELKRLKIDIPRSQLICTGDAEIVTASFSQESTAAALISHNGSTAYIYKESKGFRLGGGGSQRGDEGSGFDVGKNGLRHLLTSYDLGLDVPSLWKYIKQWLSSPGSLNVNIG